MNLEKSFAETSAPAKIILFGEHFVVYNKPAILASVTKRIKVGAYLNNSETINIKSDLGIQGSYKDSNFKLIKGRNDSQTILYPLYASARSVLSERHQILGLDIVVNSEIPHGVGLGSSAASCVATVAAVARSPRVHRVRARELRSCASELAQRVRRVARSGTASCAFRVRRRGCSGNPAGRQHVPVVIDLEDP